MLESVVPNPLKTFAILLGTCLGLLTLLAALTETRIQANEQQAKLEQLQSLLPDDQHITNTHLETLNSQDQVRLGELSLRQTLVQGYSGPLRIVTLINTQTQQLVAASVLPPISETPGLGDVIDPNKNDWITQFQGPLVPKPQEQDFDTVTGATISTQAVIRGVIRLSSEVQNEL